MLKKRGFEVVTAFLDDNLNIPLRATEGAAGYDFEASEDVVIPGTKRGFSKPVLVPTGIKSFMQKDEFLQLANRSGNPMKSDLIMTNGVGVIDSDYYNNENNEGHIMFQFINRSEEDFLIKKGERIGQGVFLNFLVSDNDVATSKRTGGFGSTGTK